MAIQTLVLITETKADVVEKKSWIGVSIVVSGGSGTISGGAVSIQVPGSSTYTQIGTMNGVTVSADTATTAFSYSGVVPQASTGGGTVSVQYAAYTLGGESVATGTKSFELSQMLIPTTITFGTFTAGTGRAIRIQRANTTYRTTITTTVLGTTYNIVSNTSASIVFYAYPISIFDNLALKTATEVPATIEVKTIDVSSDLVIGTRRYSTTVYVPMVAPVITNQNISLAYNPTPGTSYVTAESLTGKYYNNGLTDLVVQFTATPQNYADIRSVELTGDVGTHTLWAGDTSGAVSVNATVSELYGITGSNTALITVTDTRGNRTQITYTFTLDSAIAPTLTNVALERGFYSGGVFTEDTDGTSIRVTATLSSDTTMADLHYYKAGTLVESVHYSSGNLTYYYTAVDPTVNTELKIVVENKLSSSEYTYIAAISKPDFNYNAQLHSIALGTQADRANTFQCHMREELVGQLQIYGDIVFDLLEQTGQRVIRFGNGSGSTNHHDVSVFGGNPNSANGFGIVDNVNNHPLLLYATNTQKLDIAATSFSSDGQLTMTRTTNNYVNATSFARMTARRKSNILFLNGNLAVANLPSNSTTIQIGTITGWSATDTVYLSVPCQTGTGVLYVQISTSGAISIYNGSGSTINGFCRFQASVPANN